MSPDDLADLKRFLEITYALHPRLVYGRADAGPAGSVSAFSLKFISTPHVERVAHCTR